MGRSGPIVPILLTKRYHKMNEQKERFQVGDIVVEKVDDDETIPELYFILIKRNAMNNFRVMLLKTGQIIDAVALLDFDQAYYRKVS